MSSNQCGADNYPSFMARDLAAQAVEQALTGEVLEVHGRFTVVTQAAIVRDVSARVSGIRAMVAIRSFYRGYAGFSYTTDTSLVGLNNAIHAARASRTLPQALPLPGPPVEDDGLWENRSIDLSQFEKMWDPRALGTELTLHRAQTNVIHARSDNILVEYSEGSSSATVNRGPRTEAVWSRELGETHLQELLRRAVAEQEKPWSLAHHPMIFLGAAGAAVIAIVLRGLIGAPPHLAVKVATRLSDKLCVVDDASDPTGPAGGPFDTEGWPTQRRLLVKQGELMVDPNLWGHPSGASGTFGLSWRRDLARPPVLAPSNVMLVTATSSEMTSPGGQAWIGKLDRGFVCDSVTLGALSFNSHLGTFAVPCSGHLVRGGEVMARRVRGVLQGSVSELASGIMDVNPLAGYTPLDFGIRNTDVFVVRGVSLRS